MADIINTLHKTGTDLIPLKYGLNPPLNWFTSVPPELTLKNPFYSDTDGRFAIISHDWEHPMVSVWNDTLQTFEDLPAIPCSNKGVLFNQRGGVIQCSKPEGGGTQTIRAFPLSIEHGHRIDNTHIDTLQPETYADPSEVKAYVTYYETDQFAALVGSLSPYTTYSDLSKMMASSISGEFLYESAQHMGTGNTVLISCTYVGAAFVDRPQLPKTDPTNVEAMWSDYWQTLPADRHQLVAAAHRTEAANVTASIKGLTSQYVAAATVAPADVVEQTDTTSLVTVAARVNDLSAKVDDLVTLFDDLTGKVEYLSVQVDAVQVASQADSLLQNMGETS